MLTFEKIQEINKTLKTIPQKGKEYVTVDERVKAFRTLYPEGAITTEMLFYDQGKVVFKATCYDDTGKVLATGHAEEIEGKGFVNTTSFIENAETSAVGRCLGFLYLGATSGIASFDEVVNANNIRETMATDIDKKTFLDLCSKLDVDYRDIAKKAGARTMKTMTKEQHGKALLILKEIEEGFNE